MLMSAPFEIGPACRLVGSRENFVSSFSVSASEFYYFTDTQSFNAGFDALSLGIKR